MILVAAILTAAPLASAEVVMLQGSGKAKRAAKDKYQTAYDLDANAGDICATIIKDQGHGGVEDCIQSYKCNDRTYKFKYRKISGDDASLRLLGFCKAGTSNAGEACANEPKVSEVVSCYNHAVDKLVLRNHPRISNSEIVSAPKASPSRSPASN